MHLSKFRLLKRVRMAVVLMLVGAFASCSSTQVKKVTVSDVQLSSQFNDPDMVLAIENGRYDFKLKGGTIVATIPIKVKGNEGLEDFLQYYGRGLNYIKIHEAHVTPLDSGGKPFINAKGDTITLALNIDKKHFPMISL